MTRLAAYLLQAHLLFAVLALLFVSSEQIARLSKKQIPANVKCSLLRFLLLLILLFPLVMPKLSFLPSRPAAQIWSAQSFRKSSSSQAPKLAVSIGESKESLALPLESISWTVVLASFLGLSVALILSLRDRIRLHSYTKSAGRIRSIRQVDIIASATVGVPFSYGGFRKSLVVIPLSAIEKPKQLRLMLQHEFTHLRRRDTFFIYLETWLKGFFCINPFAHLIFRNLNELIEIACDEAMVDQKKVSPQAYGRCLWEVAHNQLATRAIPVGTTGMARSGDFLKWRIKTMLRQKEKLKPFYSYLWAGVLLCSFSVIAANSRTWVQDRRITMEEAQQMREKAIQISDFPVALNEEVLKELNRYLGTPDGREFIQRSLENMEVLRPTIEGALAEYRLPKAILAVPLVESGYENMSPGTNGNLGAGLWQFIPQTARNYGLVVEGKIDERRDAALATDAACRYLASLHMQLRDWQLAAMAYNAGENKVQRGIKKTKSRDAWTLIRAGFGGDEGYLAKINAAILILSSSAKIQ